MHKPLVIDLDAVYDETGKFSSYNISTEKLLGLINLRAVQNRQDFDEWDARVHYAVTTTKAATVLYMTENRPTEAEVAEKDSEDEKKPWQYDLIGDVRDVMVDKGAKMLALAVPSSISEQEKFVGLPDTDYPDFSGSIPAEKLPHVFVYVPAAGEVVGYPAKLGYQNVLPANVLY